MNLDRHPCFNPGACKTYGRVHLPVAPRCNIQCNFCNRKFDCVNESRPGVSSTILKPHQALAFLDDIMETQKNISVVGIAGPGDPFANPEETMGTLELIHEKYPEIMLCLASNGLALPPYIDDLAKLNVSHVTVTINAVDTEISEKIYSWVRYGKRSLAPAEGAKILLERQLESVARLKEKGLIVKINSIVLPGINDHHIVEVAKKMAEMDVNLFNCIPFYPNEGSNFAHLPEPPKEMISKIQSQAKEYVPQMLHCKRCRADAVGLLGDMPDENIMNSMRRCATLEKPAEPVTKHEPAAETEPEVSGKKSPGYVAIGTREGVLVNQHLGEAQKLSIYDISKATPELVGYRDMPEPGGMDFRWHQIAEQIKDCDTLLVSGIGERPRTVLSEHGLKILELNGLIFEILDGLKNGKNLSHLTAKEPSRCSGMGQGTGMGCM